MGYVHTYCTISGCSPVAEEHLDIWRHHAERDAGGFSEVVVVALKELAAEVQGWSDQVTVVGPTNDYGSPLYQYDSPADDVLLERDVELVKPFNAAIGGSFDLGAVDVSPSDSCLVSYGANIMCIPEAVSILEQATSDRVPLLRLWKLAIKGGNGSFIPHLDYETEPDQFLIPFPDYGFECAQTVADLKHLGTVEAVKHELTHGGGWWHWMRPDRFPLEQLSDERQTLTDFRTEESTDPRPGLNALPVELLIKISSNLPLKSWLAMFSSSRALRSCLSSNELRSTIAQAWLASYGCFWRPPTDETTTGAKDYDWWAYVRRCCESGSMRNRARIWRVCHRIEDLADNERV